MASKKLLFSLAAQGSNAQQLWYVLSMYLNFLMVEAEGGSKTTCTRAKTREPKGAIMTSIMKDESAL